MSMTDIRRTVFSLLVVGAACLLGTTEARFSKIVYQESKSAESRLAADERVRSHPIVGQETDDYDNYTVVYSCTEFGFLSFELVWISTVAFDALLMKNFAVACFPSCL